MKLGTALFLLLSACAGFAQQPSAAARQTVKKTTPVVKQLTVDDVLAMVSAGLSDNIIIAKLRKEDNSFDLSTEDLIRLKKAKVSDGVLRVMMDPKAVADPAPSAPAAPAVTQVPMLAGLTGIPAAALTPSGATPTAGANMSGDLNDPQAPHDSGIYLFTKDREGKAQMVVLERAAYQGEKTGGLFASAMTYGIKKAKTKAVIPGARASIRISDPSPVFYFYFEDKQAGLGKTYFGASNLSNPNQFVLLRLEVRKSDRETVIGQFGSLGASSGSDANAMVAFKSERIRAGLYKVSVDGVKAGEYCFLASGAVSTGMMGAYGAGATGASDIFDFGVSVD